MTYFNPKISIEMKPNIYPTFCSYCGEYFYHVVVPTNMPVDDKTLIETAKKLDYGETIC